MGLWQSLRFRNILHMKERTSASILEKDVFEKGYAFFHRILRTNLETGEPVTVNFGKLYVQYDYRPGNKEMIAGFNFTQEQKTSAEYIAVSKVSSEYSLKRSFKELGISKLATDIKRRLRL